MDLFAGGRRAELVRQTHEPMIRSSIPFTRGTSGNPTSYSTCSGHLAPLLRRSETPAPARPTLGPFFLRRLVISQNLIGNPSQRPAACSTALTPWLNASGPLLQSGGSFFHHSVLAYRGAGLRCSSVPSHKFAIVDSR
jgi:hypothetical protein